MIEDLGSYSIERFISFMPESYFRLFERQTEALWPAQILLIALGIAAIVLACRGKGRVVAVLLASGITLMAYSFQFRLYAELTPVGRYFGWAFLVQGLLILTWGFLHRFEGRPRLSASAWIGLALAGFSIAVYPLLSLVAGRGWTGAEVFGAAPDPTVGATLGILLILARPLWLLALLPIPLLWCVVSGATVHALAAPLAWTLPVIGLTALVGAVLKTKPFQRWTTAASVGLTP